MKKYMAILAVFVANLTVACPITIVNDSQDSIIVFEIVNAHSAYLEPHQQITVGSKTSHPHIYLATAGNHGQLEPIEYEVEMIACSLSKDPVEIRYSSIQAGDLPAFLALTDLKHGKRSKEQQPTVKKCGRCKKK